jgi:glycosyltransferase involved in cell wall biosynthesis
VSATAKHTAPVSILFINLYTEMGGGEYGIYYLLKHLDRERFHPIMMFNGRGPFVDKVESLGIETVIMPYSVVMLKQLIVPAIFMRNLRASFEIKQYLKSRNIDLIQCSDVLSLLLLAPALMSRRIPVLYSVIFLYEFSRALVFNVLAVLFVTGIVTLSDLVRGDLLGKTIGLKKKTTLVYWGVDTTIFKPKTSGEKQKVRERLNLPKETPLVGLIGRYDVWKGHMRFLDAAERLIQSSPDMHFLIAGGTVTGTTLPAAGEYEQRVRARARQPALNGKITLLGHRSDVSELMPCLDVFVCSSDQEPFGLVVLEALACGIPVVSGRRVGALEIIGNDQRVFIAEQNTGDAFAGAIQRALKMTVRDTGASGTDRLSAYTWNEYARKYQERYEEMLRKAA